VMGCPEWEAANFDEKIDNMYPDWWSTKLGGWQRPQWFVQGPVRQCLSYLRAKNAGDCEASAYFWKVLQAQYWELLDLVASSEGRVRPPMPEHLAKAILALREHFVFKSLPPLSPILESEVIANFGPPPWLNILYQSLFMKRIVPQLRKEAETGIPVVPNVALAVWRYLRRRRKLPSFGFEFPREFFRLQDEGVIVAKEVLLALEIMAEEILELAAVEANGGKPLPPYVHITDKPEFPYLERYGAGADDRGPQWVENANAVLNQYRDFPADILESIKEIILPVAREFSDVLSYYDIIQGYSTDGFIPFINGLRNYTCYEHGTLRDIPFEISYNAVLCRAAYKNAAFSFVTNSDVVPSARRLGLDAEQIVCLPHAFDDQKTSKFLRGFEPPARASDTVIFFSPTRHHWHSEPASMRKGNEIFLAAAAQAAQVNRNFRMVLVEWGVDVGRSRELIRILGIEDLVSWIPTLNKADLRQFYCTSDVVVDQFVTPAMGGVTFEAMALGRRVMTRIDEAQTAEFFGAAPPCLLAHSIETCADRMLEVLDDPLDKAGRGDAAAAWFEKYHSARRTVALQVEAYKAILCPKEATVLSLDRSTQPQPVFVADANEKLGNNV
jgi:glycosyltransferase involved in cell wall biosynthesis